MNVHAFKKDGVTFPFFDADTNALVYDLLKNNSEEICSGFAKTNATLNGITYAWNGNTCTINGSNPSNASLNNIVYNAAGVPSALISGEKYYISVTGLEGKLDFRMQYKDTNNVEKTVTLTESDWITIPSDVGGYFLLRLYIAQGASFSNHAVTVNIYPMHFSSSGNGVATPQMYGAIGDGVTDDTAAVQACITNNRSVYLPEGTYKITTPLHIAMAGQKISGAGRNSIIKASGCNGFNFTTAYYYARFEDFALHGDDDTDYVGFCFDAVVFDYVFKNLYVHDFEYGFQLNSSTTGQGKHNVNTIIQQSEIEDCKYGIQILNTELSQVNALKIEKTHIHGCETGVNVTGNVVEIESCIIENCDYGVVVDSSESGLAGEEHFAGTQTLVVEKTYFERINKTCLLCDSSYDTETQWNAFVVNLSFVNNYINIDSNSNTDYPVIDLKSAINPYSYDGFTLNKYGCVFSGIVIAGNTFNIAIDMHNAKTMIDGHNLLGSDCVINVGLVGTNYWNDSNNKGYIIVNTGRAVVNDRIGFKKHRLFIDNENVCRFDLIPIRINTQCTSGSGTITLNGYTKASALKVEIASDSISSGSNVLEDSNFDHTINLGTIETFEIVYDGTMTIGDIVVEYVSKCL